VAERLRSRLDQSVHANARCRRAEATADALRARATERRYNSSRVSAEIAAGSGLVPVGSGEIAELGHRWAMI
jgi:hypothetical protein